MAKKANISTRKEYSGERSALKGYKKQYHEFARLIYPCMNDSTLVRIKVADIVKNNNILDDIWYETKDAIHAFQIKTSSVGKVFGYADFIELVPKIVKGWLDNKNDYPTKTVIPYLWTDRDLAKKSPVETKRIKKIGYFPKFIDEVVSHLKTGTKIATDWQPVIKDIKNKIKKLIGRAITKAEWDTFWKDFDFQTRCELDIILNEEAPTSIYASNILAIVGMLEDMALREDNKIERTRDEIIKKLKWEDRYKTSYNHFLDVDDATYVAIDSVIAELDAKLASRRKGYLFLEGVPGAGKSTILTKWSQQLPRVVRFYAFDFTKPSYQLENDYKRGDGVTFLYDLIKLLNAKGYTDAKHDAPIRDEYFLKEEFKKALETISNHYQATNEKTIFIIDGLDHVHREYKAIQGLSLLQMLPSNNELLDGVIFVLGSQYYKGLGLNSDVLEAYEAKENVVHMPGFTKENVGEYAKKVLGEEHVTDEMIDKLDELTSGNPLCLYYMLAQIKEDPESNWEDNPKYEKNITNYYNRITRNIADDVKNREFLGLLARVVGDIRDEFVREWDMPLETQHAVLKDMGYLFRHDKKTKTRSFFHNSFRQYLLKETTYDYISEEYSEEEDKKFYIQLAKLIADSKVESKWDSGAYLYVGGADAEFEEQKTPEAMIEDVKDFRPIWHVQREIECMAQIAVRNNDAYMMARALLLQNQIWQMASQEINEKVIVADLIEIGETEKAKKLIQDGGVLHCAKIQALSLARDFYLQGDKEEAAFLIESATPELPKPVSESVNKRQDQETLYIEELKEWAKTATYLMDAKEVDAGIQEAEKQLTEVIQEVDDISIENVIADVRFQKIQSLIELERYDEIEETILQYPQESQEVMRFWAHKEKLEYLLQQQKNTDLLQTEYAIIRQIVDGHQGEIKNSIYLDMAVWGQQVGADKETIAGYLEKVQWGKLDSISYMDRSGEGFDKLHQRIHYIEMRTYLGHDDNLEDLAPQSVKTYDARALVEYLWMVYHLAQLRMKAHRAEQTDRELIAVVKKYLKFFDAYNFIGSNDYAYMFSQHRGDFYAYLVACAAEYGETTLDKVKGIVEELEMKGRWQANTKDVRTIVCALYRQSKDKAWTEMMLTHVEEKMFDGENKDMYERQLEALKQGRAWKLTGNTEKAIACFQRMIVELSGVGYRKDYSPVTMADWICDVNKYDASHAIERIHWLTSRMNTLYQMCEHRTVYLTGRRLMKGVATWNLGMGVELGKWLKAEKYCGFQTISSVLVEVLLVRDLTEREYNIVFQYYTEVHLASLEWYDDDSDAMERLYKKGVALFGASFSTYVERLRDGINTRCDSKVKGAMLEELDALVNPRQARKTGYEDIFGRKRETEVHREKAEEFLANGNKEGAWKEAMEAYRYSSPSGWATYYDGAQRLKACQMLKEIDAANGKRIAMQQLAEDIPHGAYFGALSDLYAIIELLTDEVDHVKLFKEQFAYMNRILRDDSAIEEDKPELTMSGAGVVEMIGEWLGYAKYNGVYSEADALLKKLRNEGELRSEE